MSVPSRARELARLHLAKRRGHPTWDTFRAWQASEMTKRRWWSPQVAEADEVWHHLTFTGRDLIPMTYPMVLDNASQP